MLRVLSFLPSRLCGGSGDVRSLGGAKSTGARLAPYDSAFTLGGWVPLRLTYGVIRVARGDIHYQLCELVRVTRSFGHEGSMPRGARIFYGTEFETETLPGSRPALPCAERADSYGYPFWAAA